MRLTTMSVSMLVFLLVLSIAPQSTVAARGGKQNRCRPHQRCIQLLPEEKTWTGMLSVVTNCLIPEGCGEPYTLWNETLTQSTPLRGTIYDGDGGRIIRVRGTKKDGAINVLWYEVLSTIPYHEFLVREAGTYTERMYPCLATREGDRIFTQWNKTFAWAYTKQKPILKVRMTDTMSTEARPKPYSYELWYDGITGKFIREVVSPKNIVFCAIPMHPQQ